MLLLVLISVVGLTAGQLNLPHGHDLKTLVDRAFSRLDHDPKDGVILESEWDIVIERDDLDNDTCVTYAEYTSVHHAMPAEVSDKMYRHFDHDANNCLTVTDMQAEFHLVDHNKDNTVTLHEWDQYFTHLVTQLFGHGAGHGHNG